VALVGWLTPDAAGALAADLGGYETEATGRVEWIEG
jgi:hypothetical protein